MQKKSMIKPHYKSALSMAVVATLLASCSSTPTPQKSPERKPIQVVQATPQQPIIVTKPTKEPAAATTTTATTTPDKMVYGSFNQWRDDFIRRATASGVNGTILNNLMATASLNERVIELDRSQAEFSKMPWEYVESAASSNRISQGKNKLAENLSTLASAESLYGTPKEITTAIWGMESSFGAGMGSMNLVNALSSLAYDGRRRSFAENQLIAMVRMIERGDVSASQLQGSWAGGMGHTQFIPSTWLSEGVDGDNDGRKNPWQRSDALTSTASYLANAGWVRGLAPFYEVRLPAGFDYSLLGKKQSLDAWKNLGLLAAGEPFAGEAQAELWLPAGANGPALLLTKNFEVIRVYNNSSSYALGVALLAKRIAGGDNLLKSWPRHEQPLSRTQVQNLQRNLTAQGYDTQGVDGVAGSNTRKAFARWQADNGQIPDGFISQRTAGNLAW
ncbi:lytic murein transglycosylase [Moraxella cuniculi DSM 21768]|uniref:Lytic murein transglycosylase n=2 Tax=Moraxella cuniculi TaxID=34061 RepID=A0A1N7FTY8_9GAMM|nr:lytic murein transglycosylase [Moraxella cuniculi]SIS03717.1 lytic murein transglycosylase [Moraxella cuniculi DSM 21768]VEG13490.1 Membrane-bound lytic murein transglycosylase B precursor [Moraxella cuniculi]